MTCFCLAHAGKRQGAESREAAGDKARTAQEGSAVEIAFGLGLQRVCKHATTGLPLSAFDQHGRLLTSPDSG
jgi:hypothetical protein